MHHVTAVFSSIAAAERAVHELVQDHFNPDDIGLLVTDSKGTHAEGTEFDTGVAEGAVAGLGIWKDEANIHAEGLMKGGIVVAVPAEHEHAAEAREIFAQAGADAVRG